MKTLLQQLYEAEPELRVSIIILPDSAARDVIRQLAAKPRWDGDLSSKTGRNVLVDLGYAGRWNGINFLTPLGYCIVDALYGLEGLVSESR